MRCPGSRRSWWAAAGDVAGREHGRTRTAGRTASRQCRPTGTPPGRAHSRRRPARAPGACPRLRPIRSVRAPARPTKISTAVCCTVTRLPARRPWLVLGHVEQLGEHEGLHHRQEGDEAERRHHHEREDDDLRRQHARRELDRPEVSLCRRVCHVRTVVRERRASNGLRPTIRLAEAPPAAAGLFATRTRPGGRLRRLPATPEHAC